MRFAVLSDHGQTQGTTFRDRYGVSLPELVTEATSASVQNSSQGDEGLMFLGASLTEASGEHGRSRHLDEDGDEGADRRRGRARRPGRQGGPEGRWQTWTRRPARPRSS